jgi:hypothetical protein
MKSSDPAASLLTILQKHTKTPSTAYSFTSTSPVPGPTLDSLSKTLSQLHSKLASYLQRQSKYLNLKVAFLQYRWSVAKLRSEKSSNNLNLARQSLGNIAGKVRARSEKKNLANRRESLQRIQQKTIKVKCKIKREKHNYKKYRLRGCLLDENKMNYEKRLMEIRKNKDKLEGNLQEINKCRKRIMERYMPIMVQLENLMISKEELALSLPFQEEKEQCEKIGLDAQGIIKENEVLRLELKELTELLLANTKRIKKKKAELLKQKQNFESRLALCKVEQRYYEEKKSQAEMVKKALKVISAAVQLCSTDRKLSKEIKIITTNKLR